MRKVLIIDTSILCVWLKVPNFDSAGSNDDLWDYRSVEKKIHQETNDSTLLVLPLATIIESGNHIAQSPQKRRDLAYALADIISKSANEEVPWAAFAFQNDLWIPEKLIHLAEEWKDMAERKISLGDATIKDVAEYYASAGFRVEILTGDAGLKSYEPISEVEVPRRRK